MNALAPGLVAHPLRAILNKGGNANFPSFKYLGVHGYGRKVAGRARTRICEIDPGAANLVEWQAVSRMAGRSDKCLHRIETQLDDFIDGGIRIRMHQHAFDSASSQTTAFDKVLDHWF